MIHRFTMGFFIFFHWRWARLQQLQLIVISSSCILLWSPAMSWLDEPGMAQNHFPQWSTCQLSKWHIRATHGTELPHLKLQHVWSVWTSHSERYSIFLGAENHCFRGLVEHHHMLGHPPSNLTAHAMNVYQHSDGYGSKLFSRRIGSTLLQNVSNMQFLWSIAILLPPLRSSTRTPKPSCKAKWPGWRPGAP